MLRTTTAGLAARLDFTIDDIEDLRIAVGEASAMVLPEADPGADLVCRFYLRPGELTVAGRVDAPRRREPPTTTASPGRCSPPWPRTPPPTTATGVSPSRLTMVPAHLEAGL